MLCCNCKNRDWEEGDREHSPPGYGIYFCVITDKGLDEKSAKGFQPPPANCPLNAEPTTENTEEIKP